jgi:hypothetical protein
MLLLGLNLHNVIAGWQVSPVTGVVLFLPPMKIYVRHC